MWISGQTLFQKIFEGVGRSFQNRVEGSRIDAKLVDDTACFLHALTLRRVGPKRPAGLRNRITQLEWLIPQAESKRLSGKMSIIRLQNPPLVPNALVYSIHTSPSFLATVPTAEI